VSLRRSGINDPLVVVAGQNVRSNSRSVGQVTEIVVVTRALVLGWSITVLEVVTLPTESTEKGPLWFGEIHLGCCCHDLGVAGIGLRIGFDTPYSQGVFAGPRGAQPQGMDRERHPGTSGVSGTNDLPHVRLNHDALERLKVELLAEQTYPADGSV
jgi:hypothetical protein